MAMMAAEATTKPEQVSLLLVNPVKIEVSG
jgi:hypothetical protein